MDVKAFWELYEARLASAGMNDKAIGWACKRVAYFLESTKRVRLRDKTAEDIKAYLCKQGWGRFICRMRCRGNTPREGWSGAGSMCFRR